MRRTSDAVSGKGQSLRLKSVSADKGSMVSVVSRDDLRRVRRHKREEGQALVEFALIIPLFLMIVVGVIQFGVALNFWLDMQRVANQGARWAVVNAYPGCDRNSPLTPACPSPNPNYPDLLHYQLANERIAEGEIIDPYICYPTTSGAGGAVTVGDPVTVRMERNFNFLSIVTFFLPGNGLNVNLHASATMRLEQEPSRFVADGTFPHICPP
jgi:hypothetical protein